MPADSRCQFHFETPFPEIESLPALGILRLNERVLRGSLQNCSQPNSTPPPLSLCCFIGRRDRAISVGLAGSNGIPHLAVLCVLTSRNGSVIPVMIEKDILRRLLARFYVLQFSTFLLCLTCYSYRARELLACWLFFCFLFAVLAIAFLCALLACYEGQYLLNWVGAANTVIPELVVCLAELPQEAVSGPRILVVGVLEPTVGPYATADVDVVDANASLLLAVPPSTGKGVSKRTDTVVRVP